MRDGRVPAFVCRDPDLHQEWKTKLFTIALLAFAAGVLLQWQFHLLP